MKLLVPIDPSQASQQLLDEVARRPWPSATTVCILHVIDWAQLPSSASLIEAVKQSAELLVKSASAKLGCADLRASTKVFEGHPRIAVAEYAREWGADLVLVGSHGASGLVRFLLGSVAQAVLRRSPCSVEIVRRSASDTSTAMRILIATDGSDCSTAAVKSVAQRPWPAGSQIRLTSVISVTFPIGISRPNARIYLPTGVLETLEKEARGRAEEAVVRARQILSEACFKAVETEFQSIGDARQVILDQERDWGANLIVVGSHGYRGIDKLMLGSVSESVAMHAHCSVEVIRE